MTAFGGDGCVGVVQKGGGSKSPCMTGLVAEVYGFPSRVRFSPGQALSIKEILCEDNTILWISKLCSCVSVRWCFIELV